MLYKVRDIMRLLITVLVVFEAVGIHLPFVGKSDEKGSKTVVLTTAKASRVCEPTI